jgi:hypothetical protein
LRCIFHLQLISWLPGRISASPWSLRKVPNINELQRMASIKSDLMGRRNYCFMTLAWKERRIINVVPDASTWTADLGQVRTKNSHLTKSRCPNCPRKHLPYVAMLGAGGPDLKWPINL